MRTDSSRVECEVKACEVTFKGKVIRGVRVSCTKCDHEVDVGGEGERSIRRGLMMLREGCPNGENNFYTVGDEE